MSDFNDHNSFPAVAVTLIIATGAVLAGMDALAKFLALEVPIIMVLWGRYFFHTVITFSAYSLKTRSLQFLRARRPGLQFIRAFALFGATFFMYEAITRMPLGDAAAIQFLAPVLVTVLSGFLLGEHVGPRRWMAVAFGFVGVLLVARPGSGVLGWNALLPLATAVLLAVYMMMTRIIRNQDDPAATTFYSTALGALILSGIVIFNWQALTEFQWGLMIAMGAAGAGGHFMLVKAFHMAEASMLAPFTYAQVVAAIAWGFLVFGEVPSLWTISGAGVVVASGLYVWYRETRATMPAKQS
ncbi:MAG: DMT family transporter [Marinobacter sp.]|jgi:drug/metabolite transporter (DMT)-like permease|nr:DMT family transporter [Marinobacter sp.]MCL1481830.1 DMT family transporter [Marinobacter sp.]